MFFLIQNGQLLHSFTESELRKFVGEKVGWVKDPGLTIDYLAHILRHDGIILTVMVQC